MDSRQKPTEQFEFQTSKAFELENDELHRMKRRAQASHQFSHQLESSSFFK